MKACPKCGAPGAISVEPILVSKPVGTYSIAGVQAKVVAEQKYMLAFPHCDPLVKGHLEDASFDEATRSWTGGHFVADEPVDLA
jgi:hypothetical protein